MYAERKLAVSRSFVLAAAAAMPVAFQVTRALAADLTWDNNGNVAPNPQDGVGTWDTTLLNFWDGTSHAWNNANSDTAVFGAGATGGVVTVNAPLTVGGIRFDVAGYNLTSSAAATNTITMAGATPTITANANAIINTPIVGANAITINVAATASIGLQGSGTISNTGGAIFMGGGTFNTGSNSFMGLRNGAGTLSGINIVVSNTQNLNNAFFVTTGTTNQIVVPTNANATLSSTLTGDGTVGLAPGGGTTAAGSLLSLAGNNSGFLGTFKFNNLLVGHIRWTSANAGAGSATWDLSGAVGRIYTNQTTGTFSIGALTSTSGGFLQGGTADSATGITYEIGNLNTDTTFNGQILDGNSSTDPTSIALARRVNVKKIGNGRLTLGGTPTAAQAYNGTTIIHGGTLTVLNASQLQNSSAISVNFGTFTNAGALDLTSVAGGYTMGSAQTLGGTNGKVYGNVTAPAGSAIIPGTVGTASTINFAHDLNISGAELRFDLANSTTMGGAVNDFINVTGGLNLASGTLTVNPLPGGLTTGTYTLASYNAASLSGSASNIPVIFGQRAAGVLGASGGVVTLNITSVGSTGTLNWNGTANGNWNVSQDQNWFNTNTSSQDAFFQGDAVNFGDAAGVITAISKVGLLNPGTFTINANTNNYTIAGAGTISGAVTLIKSGLATATLTTANDFGTGTFGATVSGGTLVLGNVNAISANAASTINIGNGAVMVTGGIGIPQNIAVFRDAATIGGNGSFGGVINDQNPLDHGGVPGLGNTNVSIPAGQTFSVNPTTLGTNFTGTLNFGSSAGTFRFTGGTGAANIVSTLGKFNLGIGAVTVLNRDGNNGTINIGAISGGPNTTLAGATNTGTLTTYTVGAANVDSTFSGRITDGSIAGATVAIVKTGSGTWTLEGNSSYTGTTAVSQGALVQNGSHFGGGAYTVSSTLGGSGLIGGQVNVGGGAHVAPGAAIGKLTVGSLSLSSSNLDYDIGSGSADSITVLNANGLTFSGTSTFNFSQSSPTFGRYVLIDYSGAPLADLSSLSPSTTTINGVNATLQNNVLNTSVDLYVPNPTEIDSQWGVNGNGTWTNNANWTNNTAPNGVDNVATFGAVNTTSANVDLPVSQTVALVNFNSTGTYTISGPGAVTLDASGGYVGINVLGGNPSVQAPVTLGKNAIFAVSAGASLGIAGNISGANSITKSAGGVLTLSGINTYTGSTTVNGGTLAVSGNDAIGDASATNTLILVGGALKSQANFTSPATRGVQLLAGGGTVDAFDSATVIEIDGVVSGPAPLTKVGPGTLLLGVSNTYTGLTTVSAGTLQTGVTNAIAPTGAVVVDGATAALNLGTDHSQTVTGVRVDNGALVTGAGTSLITMASGSYDIRSGTIGVPLAGAAGLSKTTPGGATLTVNATYTGATTINGGTLTANKLGGATLTVSTGSLKITSKGTANSAAGTSVVTALSIAAGGVASIDLSNNALIVNYTGAVGTQVGDLRDHIFNSRLTSSAAAGTLALGYADASVLGRTTFGGVANDTTSILVGLVLRGDENLDGTVNALDFNTVATNFGAVTGKVWTQGDFNYDGLVNNTDFTAMGQNFGQSIPAPAPVLGSLVPEPASLSALALLGVAGRRRRRA